MFRNMYLSVYIFSYGALNPLNFLEGIHRSFGWVAFAKFQTLHDYEKYIRRLNSIPQQVILEST